MRRTGTRIAIPWASHASLGLASHPLPAWQPGSAWIHASGKQMPFQPLMAGSGAGGWRSRGWGAVREGRTPRAPAMGQERTPSSLLQQVPGQGGSTTVAMAGLKVLPPPCCTLRMCTQGPLSLHPPFAGAGAAGSDAQPWQQHRGGIAGTYGAGRTAAQRGAVAWPGPESHSEGGASTEPQPWRTGTVVGSGLCRIKPRALVRITGLVRVGCSQPSSPRAVGGNPAGGSQVSNTAWVGAASRHTPCAPRMSREEFARTVPVARWTGAGRTCRQLSICPHCLSPGKIWDVVPTWEMEVILMHKFLAEALQLPAFQHICPGQGPRHVPVP